MSVRLCVLVALAAIVVPTSGALAAGPRTAGGIGVRLLAGKRVAPADSFARSFIVERVAPGTSISRRVEISNSTRSSADVSVYPAGAWLHGSAFAFVPGHGKNELSSWTSVGREALRMPSGSKTVETVTITVPRDASPGKRYAVVWAEVSAPAPAAGGVRLVNRVGIRIYLSIGLGGAPAPGFAVGAVRGGRSADGRPLVLATVRNTGGRTLDISGKLTLSNGPGGLRTGPFPVELEAQLAPAASEPLTARLHKGLPRGPWRVEIRLRSGLLSRAVHATISFPSAAAPPATERAATDGSNLRTYAIVGLLCAALVAACVLLLSRRRVRVAPG